MPQHLPFDPAIDCIRIDVMASGTNDLVILKGNCFSFDNAHIKNHSRLRDTREFRALDELATFRVYELIVTSLDVPTTGATFGIATDYIVESLIHRPVSVVRTSGQNRLPSTLNKTLLARVKCAPRDQLLVQRLL